MGINGGRGINSGLVLGSSGISLSGGSGGGAQNKGIGYWVIGTTFKIR